MELKISRLMDNYVDNEVCIEGDTWVDNEELKGLVLEQAKTKQRMKPLFKGLIAAAVAATVCVAGVAVVGSDFKSGSFITGSGIEFEYELRENGSTTSAYLDYLDTLTTEDGGLYLNTGDITVDITDPTDEDTAETDTTLSPSKEYSNTDFSKIENTFEDIIAESNYIVRAKFVSCADRGDYYDYTFAPIETIKNTIGEEIGNEFVTSLSKEYNDEQCFTEGEYILPLTCVNSVYFDAPVFAVTSYAIIPCDNANDVITDISVDGISVQASENLTKVSDFVEYANSVEDRSEPLFRSYITSTSLNDLVRQSDYIVKAVISDEPLRSGEDRGIYTCSLTQCCKGKIEETFEAVFMYDSVEVGEEYYFFLTKNHPDSAIYIVSSKNSIYGSDDPTVVKALEDCGIM